jgi:hypothetical protein
MEADTSPTTRPAVGDEVRFHHQTWDRTGTVAHVTPTRCTVTFTLNDGTPRSTVKHHDEVTVVTATDEPVEVCAHCGEPAGPGASAVHGISGRPEVGKVHGRCVGAAIKAAR